MMKTFLFSILMVLSLNSFAGPDCSRAEAKNIAKQWLQQNYSDLGNQQINRLVADTFYDEDLYQSWITYIVSNNEVNHFIKVRCNGTVQEMIVPQN